MLFGTPETMQFLAAIQRVKRQQRKQQRQARLAKQRVRSTLRRLRDG